VNVSVACVLVLSEIFDEVYGDVLAARLNDHRLRDPEKVPPFAPVSAMIRAIVSGGPDR